MVLGRINHCGQAAHIKGLPCKAVAVKTFSLESKEDKSRGAVPGIGGNAVAFEEKPVEFADCHFRHAVKITRKYEKSLSFAYLYHQITINMSKEQVPTPHIEAAYGEIAETVIMSGDPLRAKFMAENFLENPVQYNNVRGMLGFTGYYKGKRVSVQGHGMGIPSIGIYSYELFRFYDVKKIIRVGTAGAMQPDMKLGDMIIGMGACTDSEYARQFRLPGTFAPIADFEMLRSAVRVAEENGIGYRVGNLFSSDIFYDESKSTMDWAKYGVLGVEMEAAALYMNAAAAGKKALTICSVSDNLITGEKSTPEERRTTFTNMMKIAFEIA